MKRVTGLKRGFKAVKEEEERTKKLKEQRQGKLWRIFFPKDADEDYEIPFVFVTDEPLCFYEHNIKIKGKYTNVFCTGDDELCQQGNRPRFMGAFLGIDLRPFEIEEKDSNGNKTGKKKTIEASFKLLVRGQTDLAVLNKKKKKYGLLGYLWNITKTGESTSTRWDFEKDDKVDFSEKELVNLLPDKYRGDDYRDEDGDIDFYKIVEEQVTSSADLDIFSSNKAEDKELEESVQSSVQKIKSSSSKKRLKHKNKGRKH